MPNSAVIIWIYGALSFVGGVGGFAAAHSVKSLIAGVVCGALLFVAGLAARQNKSWGVPLGMISIFVLMLFFVSNYFGSTARKLNHNPIMALLGWSHGPSVCDWRAVCARRVRRATIKGDFTP